MNSFFHAAPMFGYATGAQSNIDLAAAEFKQSIYNYLRDRYGTLRGDGTNATTHGSDKFDDKYRGWSRSRIRRGLDKLKRQGPVEKDSPLRGDYISRIGSGWKSKTGLSLINRSRRGILELAFGPPVTNFLRIWLAPLPLLPSRNVRVISRECCLYQT